MIYFMQDIGGGPVKIGCTGDLAARHKQLEEYYGRPLAVLATMKGGRKEESEVHSRFNNIRLDGPKHRGCRPEQFRPTTELMAFIKRPLLVGANADAVESMAPVVKTVRFQATGEWATWVERFAKFRRTDIAKLIDAALAEHAETTGFKESPPERIP